jgi:predicted Zn-dependent protease
LALALDDEGRYAEAEKLMREAFDNEQRTLGSEHPDTLYMMSYLADLVSHEGRCDQAEKLQRQALDIRRRVLGPNRRGDGCLAHFMP